MVLAPVSTCPARRCHSRRSSVRRPWMRLLARPQCSHAAGAKWTWVRLCPSSVQLPRPASGQCDAAAPASTCLARHCSGQRLSVRRSLIAVQPYRQPAPPTTHVCCLSTSCRRSYPNTLTSVSCRRSLTRSRSMWFSRAVVDAVPPAVDGPSRRLRPRCDSLPCPRSMWLGELLSVVVLMVLPQGGMQRTALVVGMKFKRRGGELCSS